MERVPRIRTVSTMDNGLLMVAFENGVERIYDCKPLMARPPFALLKSPAFFRSVRVDPGGYGISWNDSTDLSEYELWTNGQLRSGGAFEQTA